MFFSLQYLPKNVGEKTINNICIYHMGFISANANKLSFIFLTIGSVLLIIRDKNKIKKVINMLTNKVVIFNFICIFIFSLYNFINPPFLESKLRKRITIDAILGLIVAIFSYLDLKSSIFWIIWLVAYYFNK